MTAFLARLCLAAVLTYALGRGTAEAARLTTGPPSDATMSPTHSQTSFAWHLFQIQRSARCTPAQLRSGRDKPIRRACCSRIARIDTAAVADIRQSTAAVG